MTIQSRTRVIKELRSIFLALQYEAEAAHKFDYKPDARKLGLIAAHIVSVIVDVRELP